ncbi:MAG: extracellular solute-binding protein [Frisingicoccus sp.]|uniref:5'-nucleotidase C-terminal domain-containing protein n=1 Tax=Frisingicoccus sp. TaxID=1918627 RepID=UPI0026240E37|nr:5'-nucleotidase C-terminal domain-containing protein [Frisingicoccus sp.]MDD6232260.1 extracellular solute-binding protein [Frisingicoccus sp.]
MKKITCFLLSLVMAATMLTGCGSQSTNSGTAGEKSTSQAEKKEKVVVACWGNQMLDSYTQYLCDLFPQVEFEFVLATNSTDYYRFRQDHDDMPDILTVRRFALKDAVLLKDYLYDLSNTELANTYYGSYLDSYTYDDGSVNWLPTCAEVDGIIINKTLFDEYNVPVPTDYASFVAACEAFEAVGIRSFVSDFAADYTCMEVLQGASIPMLQSIEGRKWRQQYESGATNALSEEVWLPVFENFFDFKENVGLGAEDATYPNRTPKEMFSEGKAAMFRGTGADVISFPGRGQDEVMLLPYFGQTEEDNWYLTYPTFQIAASNKGMDDPEREKLILDIMTAMVNQEGQDHISYGKNMVPYKKDVTLELMSEMDNMKPYVEQNKLYIRLASNDMFRISKDVVQMILNDEVQTAKEALDAFNQELAGKEPGTEIVAHIDTGYSNDFNPENGNQAASAIANTMRVLSGVDFVFMQSCYVASDIYIGDYSQKDLAYLANNDGGWPGLMELTGDQIYTLVETTLSMTGNRGAICNDSTLYVSSGFEMDITKNDDGYTLNALTIDGKELDRSATYSFLIYGDRDWYMSDVMEQMGVSEVDSTGPKAEGYLTQCLVEQGGQLEAPTDYITLR